MAPAAGKDPIVQGSSSTIKLVRTAGRGVQRASCSCTKVQDTVGMLGSSATRCIEPSLGQDRTSRTSIG